MIIVDPDTCTPARDHLALCLPQAAAREIAKSFRPGGRRFSCPCGVGLSHQLPQKRGAHSRLLSSTLGYPLIVSPSQRGNHSQRAAACPHVRTLKRGCP